MLIFIIFVVVILNNFCLTFLIKKRMCFIMQLYLRLGLKLKRIHPILRYQSQCLKSFFEFTTRKNSEKDGSTN